MSSLGRIAVLCATIMLGASIAGATKIPSPSFQPDPSEKASKSLFANPFTPPDPWEQGSGSLAMRLFE